MPAPSVRVKKKDGSYHFCVDDHRLNDATHKDSDPLPCINDALDYIAGSGWTLRDCSSCMLTPVTGSRAVLSREGEHGEQGNTYFSHAQPT